MAVTDIPVIKLTMKTYQNPGGKNVRGKCCDGAWPFCQKNGCDHYFKICLDKVDRYVTVQGVDRIQEKNVNLA